MSSTPALASALGLIVGALGYLALKAFDGAPSADFQFIWLAGEMWRHGADPYQPAYGARAAELFAGQRVPGAWYYPPNWWPISTLTAALPFDVSLTVWRAANAAFVVLACAIPAAALGGLRPNERLCVFSGLLVLAAFASATAISLALGQTSLIFLLGLSLLLTALVSGHRGLAALALALLMLKPQIGLPLAMFLVMDRHWWPSLLGGAMLTGLAALPALSLSGLGGFLTAYFENMARYENHGPAHPANMTGLRTMLFALSGVTTSVTIHIAFSMALAALLGWRAAGALGRNPRIHYALFALLAFFVPLHFYDLTFLVLPLIFLPALPLLYRVLAALCLLVILRANNVEALLGLSLEETSFATGSWLATIALCAHAVIGALVAATRRAPAPN
ncbi:MAG: glycosyltransferase 87 family protein [Pseudomonadota bacterium]